MGILDRFSSKPPSQDKFAHMVMDAVRQAGEKRNIAYDREQFRLVVPGEKGTRMFLGNAYQEFCAATKNDRSLLLRKFCRSWFVADKKVPDDYDDAKPDLLPVVRTRSYYANAAVHMQAEGQTGAGWPQQIVGEHFVVSLVYDLPEAMSSVTQDNLDGWGVTFYETLEVARENLLRLPHGFIGPAEGEGVYLSNTHDNYDASRLLLFDTIRQFLVKGDYVAMVPNRDTLIVTGADDVDGLKGMVALAKDALAKPRPMSGIALRLDGDDWVSWMPSASHPLYSDFRLLQVQSVAQDYGDQKAVSDRLHEKTGQDIFVASYSATQKKDTGEIVSHCVWARGVLALLPRTDRIAFMQQDREPVVAAWERVVEAVGDTMQPMGMYPERWWVSEFPTVEQLTAMDCEGLKP